MSPQLETVESEVIEFPSKTTCILFIIIFLILILIIGVLLFTVWGQGVEKTSHL